jgi:hypothetical protein
MNNLFDRIRAAQPNPLLLTADELAKLEAWLKAHPYQVSLSEKQQAGRQARLGDFRLSTELEDELSWRQHLYFTAEYNRRLPTKTLKVASKGGRPRLSDDERQRRHNLAAEWEQAKDAGVSQKDFAHDHKVSYPELTKILNWCAKNKQRMYKSP